MWNLILVGVLRGIFKIQVCFVPRKLIFDLFGQKWPARMVTVKLLLFHGRKKCACSVYRLSVFILKLKSERFLNEAFRHVTSQLILPGRHLNQAQHHQVAHCAHKVSLSGIKLH